VLAVVVVVVVVVVISKHPQCSSLQHPQCSRLKQWKRDGVPVALSNTHQYNRTATTHQLMTWQQPCPSTCVLSLSTQLPAALPDPLAALLRP
jgi:hypothetical protein